MDNGYSGNERRIVERREIQYLYPCPLHDLFTKGIEKDLKAGERKMQKFEDNIDKLLFGQQAQTLEIQALKTALGNGLGKDVKATKACIDDLKIIVETVIEKYNEKFKEFDEFRWFRSWANGLKNRSVNWALTFVFVGGAGAGIILFIVWMLYKH
jgi:hypothetical protein